VVSAAAVLALGVSDLSVVGEIPGGRRRSAGPQGSRPNLEPPVELRRTGVCGRAGAIEVRRLRSNARDRALLEKHSIKIGRETLRRWMVADGLWLSRKQRRSFHQARLRRESYGELIQIDGSDHRWFEDRGAACTLLVLVLIDDATSRLMQLRFVPSESTDSYFEALQGYLHAHG
jgi:hypothetical protein